MKYLKIVIDPFKIKGDPQDEEQLTQDIYEKLQNLIESETLSFSIDFEEDSDDDLDF